MYQSGQIGSAGIVAHVVLEFNSELEFVKLNFVWDSVKSQKIAHWKNVQVTEPCTAFTILVKH